MVNYCPHLLRKSQPLCLEFGKLFQIKTWCAFFRLKSTLSPKYLFLVKVHTCSHRYQISLVLHLARAVTRFVILSPFVHQLLLPNVFGILCWFQTNLKECRSLKEESSHWLDEKLAWVEERDSEKGELSWHTLYLAAQGQPVSVKVFTGYLQHVSAHV